MKQLKNINYRIVYLLILVFLISCNNNEFSEYAPDVQKISELAKKKGYNTQFAVIVDYSKHSGTERGYLINLKQRNIEKSFLVAHGKGMGQQNGRPIGFSNQPGSNASSLGYAVLGSRDVSSYGIKIKYWLKGLDATNSNMQKRVVVLHSWGGIPNFETYPLPIIQSDGCPTVSNKTMKFLDEFIQKQNNQKLVFLMKG
jgi:hypothetical protein